MIITDASDTTLAVKAPQEVIMLPQQEQQVLFFNLLREGMQFERSAIRNYLEFGSRMKLLRDTGLWQSLDYAHSFREVVEREAKRSYSHVCKAIRVHEVFGSLIESTLGPDQDVDHTKLIEALPIFRKGSSEDPSTWLHRAMACNSRDYKNYLREAKGKVPTDTCDHPAEFQDFWKRCRQCGHWHPVKVADKMNNANAA